MRFIKNFMRKSLFSFLETDFWEITLKLNKEMTITIDFLVIIVSFSHRSSCSFEILSVVGSGWRTRQYRRIWPENSSSSSDLAGELVSVVGSGRRTRQHRRIWSENSSASLDLAGELVSVFGSGQRTHSCC